MTFLHWKVSILGRLYIVTATIPFAYPLLVAYLQCGVEAIFQCVQKCCRWCVIVPKAVRLSNAVGAGGGVIKKSRRRLISQSMHLLIIRLHQWVRTYVSISLLFSHIVQQSCNFRFIKALELLTSLWLIHVVVRYFVSRKMHWDPKRLADKLDSSVYLILIRRFHTELTSSLRIVTKYVELSS